MEDSVKELQGRPVNYNERLQEAQLRRLDAIMDMMSGLMRYIAEKDNIATEKNTIQIEEAKPEKKPTPRKKKKEKKED